MKEKGENYALEEQCVNNQPNNYPFVNKYSDDNPVPIKYSQDDPVPNCSAAAQYGQEQTCESDVL